MWRRGWKRRGRRRRRRSWRGRRRRWRHCIAAFFPFSKEGRAAESRKKAITFTVRAARPGRKAEVFGAPWWRRRERRQPLPGRRGRRRGRR